MTSLLSWGRSLFPSLKMTDSIPTSTSGPDEQQEPADSGPIHVMDDGGLKVVAGVEHFVHSGPLPDPQSLGMYEEVLPGLADRIVKMTESQVAHRHALDRRALDIVSRNTLLG